MTTIVLGSTGLLGSAVYRRLPGSVGMSSVNIDLTKQDEVDMMFKFFKPRTVWHCAGLVGGIKDNRERQYEYAMKNSLMAVNTINAAVKNRVANFNYVSSSCAYPANCPQPMKEDMLWSGKLESSNQGYAVAKLLGMELCRTARDQYDFNYRTYIPCNLYGPNDAYGENGHALASLVRKVCDAKKEGRSTVKIWGDGTPRREFLHVDDCADALIFAERNADPTIGEINIGFGEDQTIMELAILIAACAEWDGGFEPDDSVPYNGMMQKLLDTSILNGLGWRPSVTLETGIRQMIKVYNEFATN